MVAHRPQSGRASPSEKKRRRGKGGKALKASLLFSRFPTLTISPLIESTFRVVVLPAPSLKVAEGTCTLEITTASTWWLAPSTLVLLFFPRDTFHIAFQDSRMDNLT